MGRLFGRPVRVFRGGNSVGERRMLHLEDALRLQQILQSMLPEVDQRHLGRQRRVRTSCAVLAETSTWPP